MASQVNSEMASEINIHNSLKYKEPTLSGHAESSIIKEQNDGLMSPSSPKGVLTQPEIAEKSEERMQSRGVNTFRRTQSPLKVDQNDDINLLYIMPGAS
mmetsp:Transcript_13168/g.20484  ORF Transcript_13168/g.20484 Transcript_13168/m.20484 type:complete len:99 (-) Transcript_13168:1718-2014(-)